MKISIENSDGQKVEFYAFKSFDTHIIKLSCECCEASDEIILDEHKVRTLKEFLKLEGGE
tara:strand:- start:580 stop:759 length:180 start_codon:yes stop_codon:yes gene_type:complete